MSRRSETYYSADAHRPPPEGSPRAFLPAHNFGPMGRLIVVPTADAGVSISARVDHDRWIVDCPDCGGAQVASYDDRRFFCNVCLNDANGGKWLTVVWPGAAKLADVEWLLDQRPDVANRNWNSDQTVEELRVENEAHGLPAGR